ncbi:glycosyltransferase [Pantoea ananatis]|uniref:glycosyltransferase n=1 Tax=Pantoea ananas TaxID=553 RepID=UPI0032EC47CB
MMDMYKHFSGRFIQVIESLDMYDACSNHVVNIDEYAKQQYGLKSEIYTRHYHPERESLIKYIDHLNTTDDDIILFHFSAYSEYCAEKVIDAKGLKILHYHNITPHYFFEKNTALYEMCKKGREQLKCIVNKFHFVTGDSFYNIEEIIKLGVERKKTLKLPIIIDDRKLDRLRKVHEIERNLIFVGRICENKCQHKLIEFFYNYKKNHSIDKLFLVGKYDVTASYFQKIITLIDELDLKSSVILTGAVSEAELDSLYKQSSCFISFSEHEGFGVPLLEASQYQVPVLALNKAAVSETLSNSPGIFTDTQDLEIKLSSALNDNDYRKSLIDYQNFVLGKNNYNSWKEYADEFFSMIIPRENQFSSISLVICTLNRGDYLERCLDYLSKSYNNNFEVIVVNGPSTDSTNNVINRWSKKIKVFNNPIKNLSISRNIGIRESSGDLVAFIDDDAIPFFDWFDNLLDYFNGTHNYVAGAGGPTYYAGTLNFQAKDIFVDHFGTGKIDPNDQIKKDPDYKRSLLGTNSIFRRDYLLEIGGFDEEYDYFLDETDVCFRLIKKGYLINHCENAYLRHEFAQSENRSNKYGYNWYSIVKNTVYFALTHSVNNNDIIVDELESIIKRERIDYIKTGLHKGELSKEQYEQYTYDIWRGFEAGIKAAKEAPKYLIDNTLKNKDFIKFNTFSVQHKPIHIVIVTKEFPPFTKSGGIGTLYYHLASELLIAGHFVTVIIQSEIENVLERGRFKLIALAKNAVNHSYLDDSVLANSILGWSTQVAIEIDALNDVHPVSVVDACLWDSEVYAFSLISKKLGIPYVLRLVTPLLVANEKNTWNMNSIDVDYLSYFEREIVNSADAVVPISESIKETFIEKYSPSPDVIYHKINAGIAYWPFYEVTQGYDKLNNYPSLSDEAILNKKKFLFLGRLELRKGIDVFLNAIEVYIKNSKDKSNAVFIIAGASSIDIESILSERFKNNKNIIYLGEVNDFDREKIYALADVVVFPSRYESFGLVPLEAFVHGKPVIASRAGAIPEVVINNNCGLLFEDGNSQELAEKMVLLNNDDELVKRLGQGAKARVKELSSYNSANKTLELYQTLFEGNKL